MLVIVNETLALIKQRTCFWRHRFRPQSKLWKMYQRVLIKLITNIIVIIKY